MRSLALSRQMMWQHIYAGLLSAGMVVAFALFLVFDRREPFEYLSTEVLPQPAHAGQQIVIRRRVIWHRQCEGEAWTEIVGPDRIINFYDRGSRYPYELGETVADRRVLLTKSMTSGIATYRGVIRFNRCGLTSRWWPIEVPYQAVEFEVLAAPTK